MTVFEYVLVFLTIVIGLGLTRNLSRIVEISLEHNSQYRLFNVAWLIAVVFLQIDLWFAMWNQKQSQDSWLLWEFLYFMAIAISLFIAGDYFAQSTKYTEPERTRVRRFGITAVIVWLLLVVYQANSDFLVPTPLNVVFLLGLLTLLGALSSRKLLRHVATVVFFIWSFYLLGFVGTSEISSSPTELVERRD